ncbi:MAG: small multi-drug export protein [Firmicutes bacterium]|nr:small multi-drug export protein [Bacillota bacterium]
MEQIWDSLLHFGAEPALVIVSMIPFIELRGGIILGAALGVNWALTLVLCTLGNIIPVPFLIVFGRYVMELLERTKLFGRWVRGYKRRLMGKSGTIQKYGPWGLVLFVGIPLPGTGAWSGALLAVLLGLRMKAAVPAILLGVLLGGAVMTLGTQGIIGIFQ